MTFLLMAVNEFHEVVSQSFILHVACVGEGGVDDANDSWGKGLHMYRWPHGSIRYSGGVEKVGGPLDKVCLSRDCEEGSHMLLLSVVASFLSDIEELGVVDAVFIHGVGSIGDEVVLSCDVGGVGHLTGQLTHASRAGVIFAVGIMAEAGVLESVFMFRGVDIGLGGAVKVDGLSLDDLGIGRLLREYLVGCIQL